MKKYTKLFVMCLLLLTLACQAFAEEDDLEVGFLTRLKTTPEEFYRIIKNSWTTRGWAILGGDHSANTAKFYDTLMTMQMAVNRGDIEEMILPDFVAQYILRTNDKYTPSCTASSGSMYLCFGFLRDNRELLYKWNAALYSMRDDYTLAGLEQKYLKNSPSEKVRFERIKGAPTVRVAVTGDLPPIDYIGADGTPSGYSTAVLAEIGKRLRLNIVTVNVSAAARTAALVSGRVDVVFWYEVNSALDSQPDVSEEVILSEPYFRWDTFMHLRLDEE